MPKQHYTNHPCRLQNYPKRTAKAPKPFSTFCRSNEIPTIPFCAPAYHTYRLPPWPLNIVADFPFLARDHVILRRYTAARFVKNSISDLLKQNHWLFSAPKCPSHYCNVTFAVTSRISAILGGEILWPHRIDRFWRKIAMFLSEKAVEWLTDNCLLVGVQTIRVLVDLVRRFVWTIHLQPPILQLSNETHNLESRFPQPHHVTISCTHYLFHLYHTPIAHLRPHGCIDLTAMILPDPAHVSGAVHTTSAMWKKHRHNVPELL